MINNTENNKPKENKFINIIDKLKVIFYIIEIR